MSLFELDSLLSNSLLICTSLTSSSCAGLLSYFPSTHHYFNFPPAFTASVIFTDFTEALRLNQIKASEKHGLFFVHRCERQISEQWKLFCQNLVECIFGAEMTVLCHVVGFSESRLVYECLVSVGCSARVEIDFALLSPVNTAPGSRSVPSDFCLLLYNNKHTHFTLPKSSSSSAEKNFALGCCLNTLAHTITQHCVHSFNGSFEPPSLHICLFMFLLMFVWCSSSSEQGPLLCSAIPLPLEMDFLWLF